MEHLTDEEIEARLEALVKEEREGLVEFLRHLDEFDKRRLANKRAYPSTFEYCSQKLGLSEDEAYRRIHVARKSRQHPQLLAMLADGTLSLTAASRLAPSLTEENRTEVLASAEGKTVKEIEKIVAELNPLPEPPRDTVKMIALELEAPASATQSAKVAYRLSITLSDAGYEKLQRATDLLRHKHPAGQPHDIVEDALDALLNAVDRDRKEAPSKPRGAPAPGGRRIPEWVKDLVWKRDGGRCAFVAKDGRRCEATAFLQYDHATPFAFGGASDDPRNVRLLCAAHNRLAAREAGVAIDRAARGE